MKTVEPRMYPSMTLPLNSLNPSTDAEPVPELMPVPEQVSENELDPATAMITSSEPEVPLLPAQDPPAEHEVAKVEVQVSVTVELVCTELPELVSDTVAEGNAGAEAPPPPPPPQADSKIAPSKVIDLDFMGLRILIL